MFFHLFVLLQKLRLLQFHFLGFRYSYHKLFSLILFISSMFWNVVELHILSFPHRFPPWNPSHAHPLPHFSLIISLVNHFWNSIMWGYCLLKFWISGCDIWKLCLLVLSIWSFLIYISFIKSRFFFQSLFSTKGQVIEITILYLKNLEQNPKQ